MTTTQPNSPSRVSLPDQYTGIVDNRCCFCLNLRIGVVITGIVNAVLNIVAFSTYIMTDSANSHWKDPTKAVNNLDISYLVVFTLQIVCDIILIWGAFKKIPHHAVPWLWANAIIIAVFLLTSTVFIALMLFFGHVNIKMGHGDFVSALAGIGILGAVHIFSWLVVFQWRKNLMEEQRVLARLIASAPLPPTDDPPVRQERAPSPPPAYDEVTKESRNEVGAVVKDGDVKIDINESPPEYAMAIAMSLNENVSKTTAADKDPSK